MIIANTLRKTKAAGKKISMLTVYESSFAALVDKTGIDVLLVSDSLEVTIQGRKSTLPVSLRDMCYHTENIARGTEDAMIVADPPFGAYQQSKKQAFAVSTGLMAAGTHMVRLEGGVWMVETAEFLQIHGIPACAHIDLTPQSVFTFGGYKVQGHGDKTEVLLRDAEAHDVAGAAIILMECAPMALAKRVTEAVGCPTIDISAGADCGGQVLVVHDMLGIFPGKIAKFVKNFMAGQSGIREAVRTYIAEIKVKTFPTVEHIFEE